MGSLTAKSPWFLWPFTLTWDLVTGVLELVGRILCAALGFMLMAVGVLLTMTKVGAWLGIPLAALGLLLLARALF
jgi:hypothetical protein